MARRPLLRGRAADEAREALRQISRALIALPPRRVRGPSLSDGDAGEAALARRAGLW